jgi:hypothetical protein
MLAQDYTGPVHWVIVDDGAMPQDTDFKRDGWMLEIVRPTPHWVEGMNTQARNLLAGLDCVAPDSRLVIIEDDDHYKPDWLSKCAGYLEKAELVGEHQARYYNLATRTGRQLTNTQHASLCSTAMRGEALASFRAACERSPKFIDLDLWKSHPNRALFTGQSVTGIKGLPGRGGIGMGHANTFRGQSDASGDLLRKWIGDDARHYL